MRLIVAANRAPIRQQEDGTWAPSIGGLATALLPVLAQNGGVWIAAQDEPDLPLQQPYPADAPDFEVRRVPVSEEEYSQYYAGMSNRTLWPISHYMMQHVEMNHAFMDHYRRVNERIADAVIEAYEPGDLIWLQDYHLMLVADRVRQALPDAHIALFWHIPWAAMELFRVLPWARELVRGMLGCDLVGFHVEEYVENFVETARTLLGAEVDGNTIYWQGREVHVEAHPIGIEVERFEAMAADDGVRYEAEALRRLVATEFLVVGIDRLDYTKGILSRLLAFERFLNEYPEYRGRITFYQVATPSRTSVDSYQQLKREVDEAVGRINGAFAQDDWVPVNYRYRAYTQEELAAFYTAADVALITPLRDGMNLVTLEFVAASSKGALVLSELTGAAQLMPEAVQVNPYDEEGLVRGLKTALELSEADRRQRLGRLKERVRTLDVHRWAANFLASMKRHGAVEA